MSTYNSNNTYNLLVEYIKDNQNSFYITAYGYVKNRDAALDIVQEAVYKALYASKNMRSPEYMKTWFYRILINTSISYLRKNKNEIVSDEILEGEISNDKNMDEIYDLYTAVDRLDQKYKTVIILRYFEDMKIEDIAKVLDKNISTIKSRLYKAIEELKMILEKE